MREVLGRMIDAFRLELALQLGLATLLGGAIGLERELKGKPAGLRTNILICMGSVLYTQLSMTMGGPSADPTRIAAQIVTGVGFIGAGTILHARGAVVGLTSAATIWVVAAIGVALGAGRYTEALGTAVLVVGVLQGLGWVEQIVARHATTSRVSVHARPDPNVLEELETVIRRAGLDIVSTQHRREEQPARQRSALESHPHRRNRPGVELALGAHVPNSGSERHRDGKAGEDQGHGADQRDREQRVRAAERAHRGRARGGQRIVAAHPEQNGAQRRRRQHRSGRYGDRAAPRPLKPPHPRPRASAPPRPPAYARLLPPHAGDRVTGRARDPRARAPRPSRSRSARRPAPRRLR